MHRLQSTIVIPDSFFKEFKKKRGIDKLRKINMGKVRSWRGVKAFWADPVKKAETVKKISKGNKGKVRNYSEDGLKRMQIAFYNNVIKKGLHYNDKYINKKKKKKVKKKKLHNGKRIQYKVQDVVHERINDYSGVVTESQLKHLEKLESQNA